MNGKQIANQVRELRDQLAESAVARQYKAQPELVAKYGEEGRAKGVRDAAYHFDYLCESIEAEDPAIFVEYLRWVTSLLSQLNMPSEIIETSLDMTESVLEEEVPAPAGAIAAQAVRDGRVALGGKTQVPDSLISAEGEFAALARNYLEALLRGDRRAASTMIVEAVDSGMSVRDVYLDVFQTSQREIGRLWQVNKVTVAQEHFATAATQMIMSQLYPKIFAAERVGRKFVGTCVGGELHEIGIRMVSDFFEMAGWDTYYLGANAPFETVADVVEKERPDVLGISATMTFRIGEVTELIQHVRSGPVGRETRILVGGYPFNISQDLWSKIGADGFAPNARETIPAAERLLA